MDWLAEPDAWIGLVTLVSLEIVLGIDNVVFISILSGKLPLSQRQRARQVGIGLAVGSRILLLLSLSWVIHLTEPLFTIPVVDHEVSGRDLILILGGLFLIGKATHEIHAKLEGPEEGTIQRTAATFTSVIIQIILLDMVFSLDSVITAVGMVDEISVMIIAVVIAAGLMLVAAGPLSRFVERHPTVKMLALSFLLLIGLTLLVEGFHQHIPKGYIYAAMGFSLLVELLNLRVRRHAEPVHIHQPALPEDATVMAPRQGAPAR
jgi:predicted tellurium resistance membrane protein TerC